MRALAAVWVVLFHFRADLQALVAPLHLIDGFMRAEYLGVDLVFPHVLVERLARRLLRAPRRAAVG